MLYSDETVPGRNVLLDDSCVAQFWVIRCRCNFFDYRFQVEIEDQRAEGFALHIVECKFVVVMVRHFDHCGFVIIAQHFMVF